MGLVVDTASLSLCVKAIRFLFLSIQSPGMTNKKTPCFLHISENSGALSFWHVDICRVSHVTQFVGGDIGFWKKGKKETLRNADQGKRCMYCERETKSGAVGEN